MLLIQILIVLFAVYAFGRVWLRYRSRAISSGEFVLWGLFWILVGGLVLMPGVTQQFAHLLGVGRGADAVFYLGLVTLSYAFFRLYLKTRDLEHQITELVRQLALANPEDPEV